jgi:hypothetical protein
MQKNEQILINFYINYAYNKNKNIIIKNIIIGIINQSFEMTLRRRQRGGVLKFTREFKTELLNSKKDTDITPIDVINLLISKVSNVRLIWDSSVCIFICF